METLTNIRFFIKAIRDSSTYAKDLYTMGDCFKFHLLLSKYFEVEPYFTANRTHIVSKYKGEFFDITGQMYGDYIPLTDDDLKEVSKWNFEKIALLKLSECPECETPFTYKYKTLTDGKND